jgi:hypothetical protein
MPPAAVEAAAVEAGGVEPAGVSHTAVEATAVEAAAMGYQDGARRCRQVAFQGDDRCVVTRDLV